MEMHQIRYFLAAAESLNFTRAAEECNVTQPALSRAIQKLERELGGDLFRRERNRTHLTDLGREMLPLLRHTAESAMAAKEHADSFGETGRALLRLGLSATISIELVAPMLLELSRALPGLDLNILRAPATDVLAALQAGDIEIGIAGQTDADWDRFDRWEMFEEDFVLLSPPEKFGSEISLSAIQEMTVIARPYCETLSDVDGRGTESRDSPRQRLEVSSDEDAARLVHRGLGVAIMPESSGRFLSETVSAIEDLDQTRTVEIYGVAGRQRSVAANAMLKLLRAADWASIVPG